MELSRSFDLDAAPPGDPPFSLLQMDGIAVLNKAFTGFSFLRTPRTLKSLTPLIVALWEKESDALDYRCLAVNSLAAGNGQFLHLGRTDPHLAGRSGDCGACAHYSGSKPGSVASWAATRPLLESDSVTKTNRKGEHVNKDRVEGKVKDIAGRVERQAGEWTGDANAQVKGAAKQVEGKVQNAWGQAKEAAKKATSDTKPSKRPQSVSNDAESDELAENERRSKG